MFDTIQQNNNYYKNVLVKIRNDFDTMQQNKNYYKNVLVKIRNEKKIYSLGCSLLQNKNEFKIIYKFYKIYSFTNNISLEYINHILTEKFPKEIAYTILISYLKNDVSFFSIKDNNSSDTFKIISYIKYCKEEKTYKYNIQNKCKAILYKDEFNIASSIAKNLETSINNNTTKNLDNIFYLNNHNIEYSNIYKINNHNIIAWGIDIL
tara:strand:- start:5646 stop:6266 length:621 start_codon:yes stop_codon:yes gene_type:complete